MRVVKLGKDDLARWVAEWSGAFLLYGPVDISSRLNRREPFKDWGPISAERMPDFSPGVTKSSIKTFYFPQPETLLTFSSRPNDPEGFKPVEPVSDERKRIVLGVRPCDARSVFLNSLPYADDPYFQDKIRNTYLVGLSCIEPCSTCFCSLVGGSAVGKEGLDILLTQTADGYIAEVVSERGEELVQRAGVEVSSDQGAIEQLEEIKKKARESVDEDGAFEKLRSADLMKLYEADFWASVAESCLNCGACTFLCPTCYCFDIQDESSRGKGRRIRYWDSCMFPLFTLHASGHNPRGQKLQRVRNRFMHKLKYFPDRFGHFSCVGCGRCIKECPVNIDIRMVLKELLSVA